MYIVHCRVIVDNRCDDQPNNKQSKTNDKKAQKDTTERARKVDFFHVRDHKRNHNKFGAPKKTGRSPQRDPEGKRRTRKRKKKGRRKKKRQIQDGPPALILRAHPKLGMAPLWGLPIWIGMGPLAILGPTAQNGLPKWALFSWFVPPCWGRQTWNLKNTKIILDTQRIDSKCMLLQECVCTHLHRT